MVVQQFVCMCVRELDESHFQVMSSLCISACYTVRDMSTDGGFAGSFAQKQFYFSPLCATEHTHTNYVCVCECRGYGRMYGYVCSCLHVHVTSVCLQRTFPLTPSLVIPTGGELSLSGWLH